VQAVWAIVILMPWGTFEDLISYVTFIDIVLVTMAGVAIFVFRKHIERPVLVLGYSIVPINFISTVLGAVCFLKNRSRSGVVCLFWQSP